MQLSLDESGFVTHPTKSIWQPSHRLIWLGFVVDVGIGQIEVPIENIETLVVPSSRLAMLHIYVHANWPAL